MKTKNELNYEASVIVVTRNRPELLKNCLASIEKYSKDVRYELIVVDSATQKGVRDYLLTNWADRATLIFEYDNTSYAASNNRAMKWSYGKFLYLMNNDCVAHPGWLRNAIDYAETNPDVGHVASLVLWPDGRVMSHGADLDKNGNTIVPGSGKPASEVQEIQNHAYAGFGLYRRDMLQEIGYLPEFNVPIYWDDTSYGMDVWRAGFDVRYYPKSVITHVLHHSERKHHNELQAVHKGRMEFMSIWGDFLKKNNGFCPGYPFTGQRPWRNGEK